MHFAHKEGREATFRAITSFIGAINGTITKYEVRRKISRGSIFILIMPLVHVPVYVCVCVCVRACMCMYEFRISYILNIPCRGYLRRSSRSGRFFIPFLLFVSLSLGTRSIPQWFRRVRDEHSILFVDLAMMFRGFTVLSSFFFFFFSFSTFLLYGC